MTMAVSNKRFVSEGFLARLTYVGGLAGLCALGWGLYSIGVDGPSEPSGVIFIGGIITMAVIGVILDSRKEDREQ
jgi:hypothetical protein